MKFGFMKGQGATEYLVLLAVVLIIALVSIALLGFFPGLAGDARKTQSDSYWRGEARPFAVMEHTMSSSSNTLSLVVQNVESDSRRLLWVNVNGSGKAGNFTGDTSFAGGERKTISVTNIGTCNSVAGTTYDLGLNFSNWASNDLSNQTEIGVKNIIGKCT